MNKVSILTLGCRLNISESNTFEGLFKKNGYKIQDLAVDTDLVVINTCTVTEKAEATCRNLIRKSKKTAPNSKIIVVGCYAQISSEEIEKMEEVDLILGTFEKSKLFYYLEKLEKNNEKLVKVEKQNEFFPSSTNFSRNHTRAFLKIQDGCDYVCSYCLIPKARGRSRSLPVKDVMSEIDRLTDGGFQEIILTGVNIGDYKTKKGRILIQLLEKILSHKNLKRLRLSSVEPNIMTSSMIALLKSSPMVMNHFHLPLQSGDDDILKLMRRKYSVKNYINTIEKIKDAFPEAGIGADIICGFPGESDKQFKNTVEVLKKLPITHFHVFPFSKREGTLAYNMDDHVLDNVKKDRCDELQQLKDEKIFSFNQKQIGKSLEVLFEKRKKNNAFEGYTPNYLKVKVTSKENLRNSIKKVRMLSYVDEKLIGEII